MKKTKIIIIIGIVLLSLFIWSYLHYKKETKKLTDYDKFGRITKMEILRPLSNIEPKAMIWRWSKFPQRGQIRTMNLEKYLKLQLEGEL